MKLKDVVRKLTEHLEKYPELADKDVYLWDEDNQAYIGFKNLLKGRKKAFIYPDDASRNSFGEDEVCYSVKMLNEFHNDNKKKADLKKIVLL